jgi:hypothetical protein
MLILREKRKKKYCLRYFSHQILIQQALKSTLLFAGKCEKFVSLARLSFFLFNKQYRSPDIYALKLDVKRYEPNIELCRALRLILYILSRKSFPFFLFANLCRSNSANPARVLVLEQRRRGPSYFLFERQK